MKLLFNVLICIIIIGLVIMIILDMHKSANKIISTRTISNFQDITYEKNRTLLYGSLFLDKLDKQIKNMTDPRITYDDKRIDIVKYSDILQ